jgi:hypothetical protein
MMCGGDDGDRRNHMDGTHRRIMMMIMVATAGGSEETIWMNPS